MENSLVVPSGVRVASSSLERGAAIKDAHLETNDSAFCALTDFHREYPITVGADTSVDDACDDMNRLGVHALLVTQQETDGMELHVVGLITYNDIQRRHPRRTPPLAVSLERSNIRVGEVMTPCNELPLVKYESLQSLTAHDLHEMFQGTGLTHLLVVEAHGDEAGFVRGLLSRATLAKRLRRPRAAAVPSFG